MARIVPRSALVPLLLFSGCIAYSKETVAPPPAAQPSSQHATSEAAAAKSDLGPKRAELERQLAIAREKMKKAQMDADNQKRAGEDSVMRAEAELDLARKDFAQFEEKGMKTRLDRARLDADRAKDAFDESKEELDQLKMMYDQQDLADKTREIVIKRGERRLQRATRSLELTQRELASLEGHDLPQARAKLQLEVQAKETSFMQTKRSTEAALLERRIGVMSQEAEIDKLENELSEIVKKAAKEAAKP